MDKRQSKCFHNGIILIVICFQDKYSKYISCYYTENRNLILF